MPNRQDFYNLFFDRCRFYVNAERGLPLLRHGNDKHYGVLQSTSEVNGNPGWVLTLAGPRGADVRRPSIGFELSAPIASTEPTDAAWRGLRERFTHDDGWVISYGHFDGYENRLCRCVKPLMDSTLIVGADEKALDAAAKQTVDALLPVWAAIPR